MKKLALILLNRFYFVFVKYTKNSHPFSASVVFASLFVFLFIHSLMSLALNFGFNKALFTDAWQGVIIMLLILLLIYRFALKNKYTIMRIEKFSSKNCNNGVLISVIILISLFISSAQSNRKLIYEDEQYDFLFEKNKNKGSLEQDIRNWFKEKK